MIFIINQASKTNRLTASSTGPGAAEQPGTAADTKLCHSVACILKERVTIIINCSKGKRDKNIFKKRVTNFFKSDKYFMGKGDRIFYGKG